MIQNVTSVNCADQDKSICGGKAVYYTMGIFCQVSNIRIDDNFARFGHGDQEKLLTEKREECMDNMANDPLTITGLYCNRTWDNLSCWPDTPANTTAVQLCPLYINGFNKEENATRHCLSNGTWYVNPLFPNQTQGWTDYGACLNNSVPVNDNLGVPGNFQDNINKLSLMYNIGYSLSLVSLVIAMAIMLYFRFVLGYTNWKRCISSEIKRILCEVGNNPTMFLLDEFKTTRNQCLNTQTKGGCDATEM
ncbi:hypothetical protein CHS0354_010134 [Potamilus streckersoni]|uniref:G-protein coupled receptors family 2 profile 1 domain-containing protein n=1 Tax=Potamilus streckersoni TaxID=2493646 RepID=A0AAE0RSJ7_9BIVA|nr:hypothetical protein CHS0354_010134 [Potamilus streckersoni]